MRLRQLLIELRATAVSMAAVLASFFTAWLIESLAHLHTNVVVLAVMLAMSFARTHRAHDLRGDVLALLITGGVSIGTVGVGWLLVNHQIAGDVLFVLALFLGIYVRRFGPLMRRAGSMVSLPFIALLVAPGGPDFQPSALLWTGLIAIVATGWVIIFRGIGLRFGLLESRPVPPPELDIERPPRENPTLTQRILPSTKLAVQMGVALAIAFAVGHAWFGHHWPWVVITTYVVSAANRNRGDVLYKSVQRLVGALAGTAAATVLANVFVSGDKWAVVGIFGVLTLANWLRTFNYAFYAGNVTAGLAFLYSYQGESGFSVLEVRLRGILCGAVIAVAVAWFVLPLRMRDVTLRRIADALAVLSDLLTAARRQQVEQLAAQQRRYDVAMTQIEQIAPTLAAHRRVRRRQEHPLDTVRELRLTSTSLQDFAATATDEPRVLADAEIKNSLKQMHDAVTESRRALRQAAQSG